MDTRSLGIRKPIRERFWKRVDKKREDDCWNWIGNFSNDGYGRIFFNGKNSLAHRISFKLLRFPVPKGLLVLHKCDNKGCVNPNHLFIGTYKDNLHDAIQKERAHQSIKRKFCKNGHPMDKCFVWKNGVRRCRFCKRKYEREYYKKKRQEWTKHQ